MGIITITLRALGHTLFELTIDGLTDLAQLDTDDDTNDDDDTIVKDVNVINWDSEPEP